MLPNKGELIVNIFVYPKNPKIPTLVLHSITASNSAPIYYPASVTFNISKFWRLLKLRSITCAFLLSLSTSALHS